MPERPSLLKRRRTTSIANAEEQVIPNTFDEGKLEVIPNEGKLLGDDDRTFPIPLRTAKPVVADAEEKDCEESRVCRAQFMEKFRFRGTQQKEHAPLNVGSVEPEEFSGVQNESGETLKARLEARGCMPRGSCPTNEAEKVVLDKSETQHIQKDLNYLDVPVQMQEAKQTTRRRHVATPQGRDLHDEPGVVDSDGDGFPEIISVRTIGPPASE
eukprot:gnl/MRDRNA2_/MRDRNA2_70238_c0_seq2.p1 gnl/MRDRNA2_/MRDRNA2_70238_c0~~gnl/MRDRNA2_/MRDRNA2_70238_c0_seq2.p1  ORF type:complete len:213 (+),score=45.51 gnl/MRDRNA2_/MRDRNA2_70238_c0_seq2:242-880(+)